MICMSRSERRNRGVAEWERFRSVQSGETQGFIYDNGMLKFCHRVCIPQDARLREEIMSEAHYIPYTAPLGATKMYQNLRINFWWEGMKKDIDNFVQKCLICQQIKVEHKKPPGLLMPLSIPEWEWTHITMVLVTKFPRSLQGHDAIWVVVDRLTNSSHFLPIRVNYLMDKLAQICI